MGRLLILLACLIFFLSCRQEELPEATEISGSVTYQDESKSVEGLKVYLSASDPQPMLSIPVSKRIDSLYLAADGKFHFSQPYKAKRRYAVSVTKRDSFWPFGVDCTPHICNELLSGEQYDLKVVVTEDYSSGG